MHSLTPIFYNNSGPAFSLITGVDSLKGFSCQMVTDLKPSIFKNEVKGLPWLVYLSSLRHRNKGLALLSGSRQCSWKWCHEQTQECLFVLEEEEEGEGGVTVRRRWLYREPYEWEVRNHLVLFTA